MPAYQQQYQGGYESYLDTASMTYQNQGMVNSSNRKKQFKKQGDNL